MSIISTMRSWSLTVLLAFAVCRVSAAELTLKHALDKAMSDNRSLLALENRVKEGEARIAQSRSAYLPQFRLNASYTYLSRLSEMKLEIPAQYRLPTIKTGTHNVLDANVSASFLLFDWGKRGKVVAQARVARDMSVTALSLARNEVAYQVIKGYAFAALQKANASLLEEYVMISEKHLQDAQSKFATGLLSQFDLLKSEMQLKVYQEQLAIARADFQEALLSLTELCGGDSDLVMPVEPLDQIQVAIPASESFDSLISAKPRIESLRKEQQLSRLSLGTEHLRPTLTATSSTGWKNSYLPETNKLQFNYAGGLMLSFPLFDGGYAKQRRQEEQEKQKSQQLEIDRLISESRRRVEILYQGMAKIDAKIRITEERLRLARKALEIASVSYGAGLITNGDYLDTELELEKTELEALQDRFNRLLTQLELKGVLDYFPEIGD